MFSVQAAIPAALAVHVATIAATLALSSRARWCRWITFGGSAVASALTLVAAVEKKGHVAVGEDAGELAGCSSNLVIIEDDLSACIGRGDVIIDFSSPQATLEHMRIAAAQHKAMVIGKGGEKLKLIGTDARRDMEKQFGGKVFLQIWVKVKQGWADDERTLKNLGFEP